MTRETIPKVPRKAGFRLSGPQFLRIGMTTALLVLILVVRKPCSDGMSKFVTDFGSGSNGAAMPKPGNVDMPMPGSGDYEVLRSDMTPEQFKAAIDRARAKNGSGSGSGSAK
ncbi:MAG: hypothetical protein NT062_29240 [Proteobacteria bacterium]|nr:hypothetical protein [Pseudomonadota bacterium]